MRTRSRRRGDRRPRRIVALTLSLLASALFLAAGYCGLNVLLIFPWADGQAALYDPWILRTVLLLLTSGVLAGIALFFAMLNRKERKQGGAA